MKISYSLKPILIAVWWIVLSAGVAIGQDTVWSRWGTFTVKPERPRVVYYPIYQGKQVVEVDFFHFMNDLTRYENAAWEEKFGHSHLGGRDMPNMPNMFIIRDSLGNFLAKYYSVSNWNEHFSLSQLLPPSSAPITFYQPVLDSIEANRNEYGHFPHRPRMHGPFFQFLHQGKVGVMDTLGNVVVKPQKYTWISSAATYPIVMDSRGLYGILGPDWTALQEPTFKQLMALDETGVFLGCLEKCGIFTVNAEVLVPFEYVWKPEIRYASELRCPPWTVPVQNEKGWGFISPDGIGEDWGFDAISAHEFGFMVKKGPSRAWFDCRGKRLTDFIYADLPPEKLAGSFYSMVLGGGDPEDYWERKYHLVNDQGKIMVAGDFSRIYSVGMGQMIGWLADQMYLIDSADWKMIELLGYASVDDLGDLLAASDPKGYVVLNRAGKVVIPGPFKEVHRLDGRRIASENLEGKFQIWNPSGELLNPLFFKNVEWDSEGWIWVKMEDYSYRLMDTLGHFVPDMIFGSHRQFNRGSVIVQSFQGNPSLFGVVDVEGNWVVPCKYPFASAPNEFSPDAPFSVSDSLEKWVQQGDGSWKRFEGMGR